MDPMSEVRNIPLFPAAGALALRFAPLWPLSLVGARLTGLLAERHPALFSRLGEQANKVFLIDPTDLPFVFVLKPRASRPALSALRRDEAVAWDARIAGPLAALIGLVHGAYDGDALFFSRDLSIEGDTEAVLALRNAIDNEELDLVRETTAIFGPLARLADAPAQKLAAVISALSGAPLTRVETGRFE
jgi:predicted lipid carrier protein YhbT